MGHRHAMTSIPALREAEQTLVVLIYELLDAHEETLRMAEIDPDAVWRAHLDYLRALQRTARELLAHNGT